VSRVPPLLHLGVAGQLLPALAVIVRKRWQAPALAIAAGGLVGFAGDVVGRVMAVRVRNNHLVDYLDLPVMVACYLWALRSGQPTPRGQRVFGAVILLFLALCVVLVALVEDPRELTVAVGPLAAATLFGAALWSRTRLPAAAGLALLGGTMAVTSLVGPPLLAAGRYALFSATWQARAVIVGAAYAWIAWTIAREPRAPAEVPR
jgi:hypothetical protein